MRVWAAPFSTKKLAKKRGIMRYIQEDSQELKGKFSGQGLLLLDTLEILKKVTTLLHRVFICIEALEQPPPNSQPEALQPLRDIIRVSPNTLLFLTGRPHIKDKIVRGG